MYCFRQEGIAQFPDGRMKQMGELRNEMANWDLPFQLCGDYLDGISSEGALATGVQAAERLVGGLVQNQFQTISIYPS